MPALLDLLVIVLLGGASYLFLSARETARDTRQALEQIKAQNDHLQALEVRLRHMEQLLYDRETVKPLSDAPTPLSIDRGASRQAEV